MKGSAYFSANYGSARDRFRAAAGRLGLVTETHAIAAAGPNGESLSIDVASTGAAPCPNVVIISSGLHGVEGFLGSAAQLAWLDKFLLTNKALPPATKAILVHAVNPYGFAWLRRWNESNVDLNRNFLVNRDFIAGDDYRRNLEAYERHFDFLNPPCPPSSSEPYLLKAAWRIVSAGYASRKRLDAAHRPSPFDLAAIAGLGLDDLTRSLLAGQYRYPQGLFYGGDGAEDSTCWLQARLPEWVAGAQFTLHIDLHSGLGKRARCTLIAADARGAAIASHLAQDAGAEAVDEQDVYSAHGAIAGYFRETQVGGDYRGLTAEFGTYPGVSVMRALRAENQAHFHSSADAAEYRAAKRKIVEAFAPAASDWRDAVIDKAVALIDGAIATCAALPSEATTAASEKP